MKSGIYEIRNLITGKRYIGQAATIIRRWSAHRSNLVHGKHHSRILQRAWDKYGAAAFEFSVLEYVVAERSVLTVREQYWMDALRPEYNILPSAGSALGRKQPQEEITRRSASIRGQKRTPEQCARIAAAKVGHGVGRKQSPETIKKRTAGQFGRPKPSGAREALKKRHANNRIPKYQAIATALVNNPNVSVRKLTHIVGFSRPLVERYLKEHPCQPPQLRGSVAVESVLQLTLDF